MISQLEYTPGNNTFPLKLFNKKNVLSVEMCDSIKEFALSGTSGWHRSMTDLPKIYWDIECHTCRIPLLWNNGKLHELLSPIWEEAIEYYGMNVTHVEQYEIKRYSEGDYVAAHVDQFFGKAGDERKLTMLLQLSDEADYTGGDLHVLKHPRNKSIGSVTILPGFYLHEVKPVITGERWSLNCWAWGPYWK
jgi:hypothetical protein